MSYSLWRTHEVAAALLFFSRTSFATPPSLFAAAYVDGEVLEFNVNDPELNGFLKFIVDPDPPAVKRMRLAAAAAAAASGRETPLDELPVLDAHSQPAIMIN